MAGGVVVALCGSSVAHADVNLIEPTIEVSAQYVHLPAKRFASRESLVGSGVHVIDRNGLYSLIVSKLVGGAGCGRDVDCRYQEAGYSVHEMDNIVIYKPTVYTIGESPESKANRERAQQAIGMGTSSYTELTVFQPIEGTSNVRGAAFGIGAAMFGNSKFALDIGVRWSFLRADVCGTEAEPVRCTRRFFGVPLRFNMQLGMIGAHAGVDWNWRNDDSEFVVGMNANVIDRAFVRASVIATVDTITSPGFSLEIGGRL